MASYATQLGVTNNLIGKKILPCKICKLEMLSSQQQVIIRDSKA